MKTLNLQLIIFLIFLFYPILAYSTPVEITIEYPPEGCSENWQCSEWSACVGGVQTRTCTDLNSCGTTYNKPIESQGCGGGGGGGGGGGTGTSNQTNQTQQSSTPSKQQSYQGFTYSIDYSVSPGIMIHSNGSETIEIKVTNTGNAYLNNLIMKLDGLPIESFKISPTSVSVLQPSSSTTFSIEINSFLLTPNVTYPTIINVSSQETYKTASTNLFVSPVTQTEAKKRESIIGMEVAAVVAVVASVIIIYLVATKFMKKKPIEVYSKEASLQ